MKGDFSRNTFNKEKHYTSVRMQQGRVQLDADWNEQADIQTHARRGALRDLIGHAGGPDADGFKITIGSGKPHVGAGHYYVDGMLCENEGGFALDDQPHLPGIGLPTDDGRYLAYLDVWDRHLTAIDSPELLEPALGGPDTSTRTQLIWQVRLVRDDRVECGDVDEKWFEARLGVSDALLAARARPPAIPPKDDCAFPDQGGYGGRENQLYRVEIHKGNLSDKDASFKWSRENASLVARIESLDKDSNTLTLQTPGRDRRYGFEKDGYVELLDDNGELLGASNVMAVIEEVPEADREIKLKYLGATPDMEVALPAGFSPTKVRRWEGFAAVGTGGSWIRLESGIEVQFGGSHFRTGDHWLIPARVAAADSDSRILWPYKEDDPQAPRGIRHSHAPLALLDRAGGKWVDPPTDCRRIFDPLAVRSVDTVPDHSQSDHAAGCCRFTVGDGGGFNNLADAVESLFADDDLKDDEIKVCLLPGEHQLSRTIVVEHRKVRITGCGRSSRILVDDTVAAFRAIGGYLRMESLTVIAKSADPVIWFQTNHHLHSARFINCIIHNGNEEGSSFVAIGGGSFSFEKCGLRGRVFLKSEDAKSLHVEESWFNDEVFLSSRNAEEIRIENCSFKGGAYLEVANTRIGRNEFASKGLYLQGGSRAVEVINNRVLKGGGQGICLGGLWNLLNVSNLSDPQKKLFEDYFQSSRETANLENIQIIDNEISGIQGSGISCADESTSPSSPGDIVDLLVARNRIEGCARELPDPNKKLAVGGIVLDRVDGLRVTENQVVRNGGGDNKVPACGIYLSDCLGVEIRGNIVAENGVDGDDLEAEVFQVGVAVLYALPTGAPTLGLDSDELPDGAPALRIHDNSISCPSGQSLLTLALGAQSVQGNTLVSKGERMQPSLKPALQLGTGVSIVSLDYTAALRASELRREYMEMDAGCLVSGNQISVTLRDFDRQIFVHEEVEKLPDCEVPTAPVSLSVMSGGDVCVLNNQVQTRNRRVDGDDLCLKSGTDAKLSKQAQSIASIARGETLRVIGNRLSELPCAARFSFAGRGIQNGNVSDNQATHPVLVPDASVVRDNQYSRPDKGTRADKCEQKALEFILREFRTANAEALDEIFKREELRKNRL